MVVVPKDTLVTSPDAATTVATEVLLLLHVPPAVASLSCVVPPKHTLDAPVMGDSAFTVTVVVVEHPAGVV